MTKETILKAKSDSNSTKTESLNSEIKKARKLSKRAQDIFAKSERLSHAHELDPKKWPSMFE